MPDAPTYFVREELFFAGSEPSLMYAFITTISILIITCPLCLATPHSLIEEKNIDMPEKLQGLSKDWLDEGFSIVVFSDHKHALAAFAI